MALFSLGLNQKDLSGLKAPGVQPISTPTVTPPKIPIGTAANNNLRSRPTANPLAVLSPGAGFKQPGVTKAPAPIAPATQPAAAPKTTPPPLGGSTGPNAANDINAWKNRPAPVAPVTPDANVTPPPASMYTGQGVAMTQGDQQQQKDQAATTAAQKSQAAATPAADQQQQKDQATTTMAQQNQAGAQSTADQQQQKDQGTQGSQTGTPAAGTAAANTTPTLDDELAKFSQILDGWANGNVDDKVFRNALNRSILQMGLDNQAQTDAMKMRINQDPALRGQGAGEAMLSMLGAQQGFAADQMFGQLASDSQQRILDMQKYGIEQGIQVNATRRQNTINDIATMQAAGDYQGAADSTTKLLGLPTGSITANDIKTHDSFSINQFSSAMQNVKDIAATDPAKATALLQGLINNPAYSSWFAPGVKAEDLVNSMVTGEYQQNIDLADKLYSEINTEAGNNVPFETAFGSYKSLPAMVKQSMIQSGKTMSIDDINAARASNGLKPWSKDANGNIVDENGHAVGDQDFFEVAAMSRYDYAKQHASELPWQQEYDVLSKDPSFAQVLKIPGNEQTVKNWLMGLHLTDSQRDPDTGMMKPVNFMGDSKIDFLFQDWPKATFGADGTPNAGYYAGGNAYGSKLGDQTIQATPDDESLNNGYAAYLHSGPTTPLTSTQWYFATAGGTKAPDPSKIPDEWKPAASTNQTNVGSGTTGSSPPIVNADGSNTTTNTDGSLTTKTTDGSSYTMTKDGTFTVTGPDGKAILPGQTGALKASQNYISILAPSWPKAAADKTDALKNYLNAASLGDSSSVVNDYAANVDPSAGPNWPTGIKPGDEKAKADWMAMKAMNKYGVPDKDAFNLLAETVGQQRAQAAYNLVNGKFYVGPGAPIIGPGTSFGGNNGMLGAGVSGITINPVGSFKA